MSANTSRHERPASLALAIIVVVGLALRLAWWAYADGVPVSDFEYFRQLGTVLLDRGYLGLGTPSAYRTPLYPALLAGLMTLSRSIEWLSLGNVLLSSTLPYLTYMFSQRLGLSSRTMWIAAGLVAVNPTFVCYSPVLGSEHLFTPLLVLTLTSALASSQAQGQSWRAGVRPGVLLGLTTLTRPDALFFVPTVMIAMWRTTRSTHRLVAAGVVAALLITPWVIRNRVWVGPGAGLSTAGGMTFYYGHSPTAHAWHPLAGTPLAGLDEATQSRRGFEIGMAYIREASFDRLLGDVWTGTTLLFSTLNYGRAWSTQIKGKTPDDFTSSARGHTPRLDVVVRWWTLALFGLAALSVFFTRSPGWRTWAIPASIVALTWVGYAIVFVATARYRYAADVFLCVLTAMTIEGVLRRLTR